MDIMPLPPWLEPLLNSDFFSTCRIHGHHHAARSECNMYCLDCNGDAFCFYCRSSKHKDHQVLQIRKSSYHNVVRVSEIQKVMDISGVQTYVINSARVLFLNKRPQPKTGKGVSYACEICGRSHLDPFRFSFLLIGLQGIKRNGDATSSLDAENEMVMHRGQGMSRRVISSSKEEEEELSEGIQQDVYPFTPRQPFPSGRRRKGISHRAPFGSNS